MCAFLPRQLRLLKLVFGLACVANQNWLQNTPTNHTLASVVVQGLWYIAEGLLSERLEPGVVR
jgi:hypothetical protein